VNASRLLFEGLEDRILLNGAPAALLGAVIHETIPENQSSLALETGLDEGFTLPKFDDQGGTRTLVGVRLDTNIRVTSGLLQAENTSDVAGILSEMTLSLTAHSYVFASMPFPAPRGDVSDPFVPAPAFTFAPGTSTATQTDLPMSAQLFPPALLNWLNDYPAGQDPDYRELTLLGQHFNLPTVIVGAGSPLLSNFIQAPGDADIFLVVASESFATVASDNIDPNDDIGFRARTQPIQYTATVSVVYLYTEGDGGEIPPYTDEDYRDTIWSRFDFTKARAPQFQPFYSGTAQPGATLTVDVLGFGGEVLGSTSTVVDAGGNWTANFYDLGMTGDPHTVSIRQSYAGYTPLTGAGYNLGRCFSLAMMGGAYASEHLTIENVLGNRAADVSMAALYSASAHPITLGQTLYAYEMLPVSASAQGLH